MSHSIVVVGAGNIGSHVVPLLARIVGLGALTIVDRDVYETRNLTGQAIRPGDVGKAKARVQAARARRLVSGLAVRAVVGDLEALPLGVFRGDLLVGCLDSRAARRRLNEIAFRVGVPYVDAGVNGAALLARVSVYDPREAAASCLLCAWGADDYAAAEQVHPCQDGMVAAAPATNAPAALGALAAALQAIECEKWLHDRPDRLAAGAEVLIDAASHTHHRTASRRNPACRLDHERWSIERLAAGEAASSLEALLAAAGLPAAGAALTVEGQRFVMQVVCPACAASRPLVRLAAALRPRDRLCVACGRPSAPRGVDLRDRIEIEALPSATRRRSLRALGLREGEVVTITHAGAPRHFEL